jgi:hypothetical protein
MAWLGCIKTSGLFDETSREYNSVPTLCKPLDECARYSIDTIPPVRLDVIMLLFSLLSLGILGAAAQRGQNQTRDCPQIHVFGARETTTPQGFGSAKTLVDLILKRFPGARSEEIIYPAAGGDVYSQSVGQGVHAVIKQTSAFAAACPDSIIIMHGYSQVRPSVTRRA